MVKEMFDSRMIFERGDEMFSIYSDALNFSSKSMSAFLVAALPVIEIAPVSVTVMVSTAMPATPCSTIASRIRDVYCGRDIWLLVSFTAAQRFFISWNRVFVWNFSRASFPVESSRLRLRRSNKSGKNVGRRNTAFAMRGEVVANAATRTRRAVFTRVIVFLSFSGRRFVVSIPGSRLRPPSPTAKYLWLLFQIYHDKKTITLVK